MEVAWRCVLSLQVSVSRKINAPLSFVYAWWTDFSEGDPKITGQKRRLIILERRANRIIMSVRYTSHGRILTAARIVTLKPPNAWHLDWIGDEDEETGDYQLRRLGALILFRIRRAVRVIHLLGSPSFSNANRFGLLLSRSGYLRRLSEPQFSS
jgi:hypothetical protein